MIINSFKELRVLIDRILMEMSDCTPQQTYQIERQIRSAHAYLAQREATPGGTRSHRPDGEHGSHST
jgi:hypothetical protein